MKKLLIIAIIGAVIPGLIGCSPISQVEKGELYESELKEDYLAEHPQCIYADNIEDGEVENGMNRDEVKASWGMPNAIVVEDDVENQFWVYYTRGRDSGSVMIYTLNFREEILKDWNIEIKRISSYFVEGEAPPSFKKISLVEEDK